MIAIMRFPGSSLLRLTQLNNNTILENNVYFVLIRLYDEHRFKLCISNI